jgi:hypothetical protein
VGDGVVRELVLKADFDKVAGTCIPSAVALGVDQWAPQAFDEWSVSWPRVGSALDVLRFSFDPLDDRALLQAVSAALCSVLNVLNFRRRVALSSILKACASKSGHAVLLLPSAQVKALITTVVEFPKAWNFARRGREILAALELGASAYEDGIFITVGAELTEAVQFNRAW